MMAYILRLRGDLDGAMRLYQEALEICNGKGATLSAWGDLDCGSIRSRLKARHAACEMAYILRLRGDLDGAMRLYQEALEIAERLGDLRGKGATLREMASILRLRGDLDGAMRLYQEALEIFERLGDLQGKAPRCARWPPSCACAATWTGRCGSIRRRLKSLSAWGT
jgi:tetratricopeptide (TPR) repeat protein